MEKQLTQYLEAIRNDYRSWQSKCKVGTGLAIDLKIRDKMTEEFCESISFKEGGKYIKVIRDSSVHSFIVKEDGGKFKKGDILKAASWNAPARNFARGNILKGGYKVSWTGAV